jgi:hypothetical protein
MAHATVSKAEESSHEQIKNQDNCCHFFRGVVRKEFESCGVTVNQKCYLLQVLDLLRRRVMRVRMEIADDWILRASS